ncbi:MAG: XcyI family restriction endonuclease [Anaerolineae bacterium]|nr:XcyI family restriction endonuclease [Anaerolineae bacterium]NUQ06181.1 XcyI family restriction endonuclease [Anaerolineae bacterium]
MMPREPNRNQIEAWTLDQLAKSAFFHRKLHDWKLIEVAEQVNAVRGEALVWEDLNISETAWAKVIHRGIKPVTVFAHPQVLQSIPGSVGYYRMLAMVSQKSQKSMKRIGQNIDDYEGGKLLDDQEMALGLAWHLNRIISALVESDAVIDAGEFDLWRGMAAGAQAQGSWQNNKGASAEIAIRELILRRLYEQDSIASERPPTSRINLRDGRTLVFSDEPDVAIYDGDLIHIAVEVKGGIDPAGVLERIGAALKSLRRARQANSSAITVLIVQDVSMTERAKEDLLINAEVITDLFTVQEILEIQADRERFFTRLAI